MGDVEDVEQKKIRSVGSVRFIEAAGWRRVLDSRGILRKSLCTSSVGRSNPESDTRRSK